MVQLKANQNKLFEQVKQKFAFSYDNDKLHEYTQTNQGHGRIEKRTVMQINAELPNELKAKWPTIRTFIEVASVVNAQKIMSPTVGHVSMSAHYH